MKDSKVLSDLELIIYQNELSSPRLSFLTEDELHNTILEFLQEISMLTGSDVYDTDYKNAMLAKTIQNLIDSNPRIQALTVAEVRHAFYLNHGGLFSKVHTMYGKPISADYVGNVLNDYMHFKLRTMEKQWAIQRILNPPKPKEKVIYTIEDYKKFIQEDYQLYLDGKADIISFYSKKYFALRKLKIIIYQDKQMWWSWYSFAIAHRERGIRAIQAVNEFDRNKKLEKLSMYEQIKKTNLVPKSENRSIINTMRKQVYLRIMKLLADADVKDIFSEVEEAKYDPEFGYCFIFKAKEDE